MGAYWLTFKPFGPSAPNGWPLEDMQALVRRFEIDPETATEWWRLASHRNATVGDRVYVFKQGTEGPRGIFGVGTIIDGPRLQLSPNDTAGQRPRALIRFDRLLDPTEGFLLALEEIDDIAPKGMVEAQASGVSVPEEIVPELERRLAPWLARDVPAIDSEQADDPSLDPDSVSDERERAFRAIRIRRGQQAFRSALMLAYGKRCVITGCAIEDVLEGAHITPYLGPLTNKVSNGLLLRSDLHTLLDCGLLGIDPDTRRVVISEALMQSSYAKLASRALRTPRHLSQAPSKNNLLRRYAMFTAAQGLRATGAASVSLTSKTIVVPA